MMEAGEPKVLPVTPTCSPLALTGQVNGLVVVGCSVEERQGREVLATIDLVGPYRGSASAVDVCLYKCESNGAKELATQLGERNCFFCRPVA